MLALEHVSKRHGDVIALDGASFQVDRARILGFLGPNGAGKTTAMRCIFGLTEPDTGRIEWEGRPVTSADRARFGYMPEERGLYPKMQVRGQLAYFARPSGAGGHDAEAAADRWLERFGLAARGRAKVEELSHGNQQRLQLVVTLAHDPVLLVLDEPFAGLDPLGIDALALVLREVVDRGVAVVFSSHQLDLVEDLCQDIAMWLHEGSEVTRSVIGGAAASLQLGEVAQQLGTSETELAAALTPPEIEPRILSPPDPEAEPRRIGALIAVTLPYMSILIFGQFVALGVMEEKQNRVVEVVLSRVDPTQLLIGKVVGIGALGLVQLVALGGSAWIALSLADVADVSVPRLGGEIFSSVILWFLLGYTMYAVIYAALGATVSRQEDLQSTLILPVIVMVPGFLLGQFAQEQPDSRDSCPEEARQRSRTAVSVLMSRLSK